VIRLEPREIYDAAIIGQDGDLLVYCYYLLIEAITKQFQVDLCIDKQEAEIMAIDDVSYNIERMCTNYKDWPIIKREP